MTRQNIFELLKKEYNVVCEINKIKQLFETEIIQHRNSYGEIRNSYYIEELFDKYVLPNWKQRNSFLSTQEIKISLKIPRRYCTSSSLNDILNALEYYENIIYFLVKKFRILDRKEFNVTQKFQILVENILLLISNLNYRLIIDEREEKVLLVPKKPEAIAVAELSSKNTALAILKYNHASLKGNLESKRKLLYQISLEYEPLLKAPIEGYKDFYEKTNALLNTLHIRHNNTQKENNKNAVIEITDNELEKWYDELYQLLLFCVLIRDNLDRKKEVSEILKVIMNNK